MTARSLRNAAAVAAGLGVGGCLSALNLLVAFKAGTAFGGAILIVTIGGLLLRGLGALTWRRMFVLYATASGGSIAIGALDTSMGASMLQGERLPGWPVLLMLGLAANAIGISIGAMLAPRMMDASRLDYPALRPAIDLMAALTRTGEPATAHPRTFLIGIGAGAVSTFATQFLSYSGSSSTADAGRHVAFALSPLLLGLGLRVGGAATGWLLGGALYSVVVWNSQDSGHTSAGSFAAHLSSPWVLVVGVGTMLGYVVGTVVRWLPGTLRWRMSWEGLARSPRRSLTVLSVSAAVVATTIAVAASSEGVKDTVGAAVLCVLLLALFSVLLIRINAEIGLAPLSLVQYACVVVFALLGLPTFVCYLLAGVLSCTVLAAVYYVEAARVAASATTDVTVATRAIVVPQLAGSVAGTVAGVALLVAVGHSGLLGRPEFPVPTGSAMGFLDGVARGAGDYSHAAVAAGLGSGALGLVLAWTKAMPTLLGLGVLLPPSTSLTIVVGGLAKTVAKRLSPALGETVPVLGSGLIIGGGVVTAIFLSVYVVAK